MALCQLHRSVAEVSGAGGGAGALAPLGPLGDAVLALAITRRQGGAVGQRVHAALIQLMRIRTALERKLDLLRLSKFREDVEESKMIRELEVRRIEGGGAASSAQNGRWQLPVGLRRRFGTLWEITNHIVYYKNNKQGLSFLVPDYNDSTRET